MAETTRRKLLARLAAEFAIIVLGVLVAFQFESWRDGLFDARREQEQLAALRSDFETNRSRLADDLVSQQRVLDAVGAEASVRRPQPRSWPTTTWEACSRGGASSRPTVDSGWRTWPKERT